MYDQIDNNNNKILADNIKNLVNYAIEHNSEGAENYYQNFNSLKISIASEILGFDVKSDKERFHKSDLNLKINSIMIAIIRAGIEDEIYYKDIYKMAKSDLKKYAELQ